MKKLLAWVMVLTMVLTMMPVMDEHNHAHAETTAAYGKCTKCTDCTGYVETGSGFMKRCGTCSSNCTGMGNKKYHPVNVECDHADAECTPIPDDAVNHYSVCTGTAYVSGSVTKYECPLYGVAVEEPHVWGDDTVCDKCGYSQHTCTFEITNCTVSVPCAGGCGEWSTAMTAHSFAISDCTAPVTCGNDNCTVESTPVDHSFPTITDCEVPVKCEKCTVWTTAAEHIFDNDCTTHDECQHETCIVTAGAADGHMAESRQTNCLVAVKCMFCEQIATPAKESHTPEHAQTDCLVAVECAKCDEIAIPAKDHDPKDDDGDCTTPIVCEDCNTVTTPAKEHDWSNGTGLCANCGTACEHTGETHSEITKAATCKKEGSANVICDTCNIVIGTETLPVDTEDGHEWTVFSFGGWYCNFCGYITVDNPTDEPDPTPGQPSVTCPDNDHEWTKFSFGGWICNKCGLKATDMGPLDPALCNHADTYQEVVTAATCKTAGTAKEICDICETVVNENVELPVDENAHDWVVFSFGAGYCKLCSKISADDSLFHDHEKEEEVCEHDWIEFSFGGWVCSKCSEITVDEEVVYPPVEEPEENTCEHEWTVFSFGGWFCNKCGYITVDNPTDEPEPVPVLPQPSNPCLVHEWTEFVFGGWVCGKCGAMTIEEPCYHENIEREIVNPTCVDDGYAKDVCLDCGATVSEVVTLPLVPTAHKWEKGVCLNGCDTKCEHPAWTDCICAVCGYECGHDDVTVDVIKAATCKEEGTGTETCNVCGNVEDVILPVDTEDGHDWIVFSFGGWFCTICGEITVDNPTDEPDPTPVLPEPANPCPDGEHDWLVYSFGGWVCKKCGMMTIDNPTEDPDPTPVLPEPSNPCEDDLHDWVEFSFGGWVCSKCGMMTTEEPCEHTIVVDAAVAPTCTETGLTEGKHCSECGKVLTAQEVVAATGHDTEQQIVQAATCKKEGAANEVCKVCGTVVNTVALPVDTEDGHDWTVFSFGGWFCNLCGYITVDNPTDEPDPTPVLPEPANPCPDGEHDWLVYSFGGWVCKKCGMMTIENPTEDPDPTPVLPEPSNPCEDDKHDWIEFSFGGWVCSNCGMMTTEEPCEHEWENGVCSICDAVCEHSSCTNGVCSDCGCMKGDVNCDGAISNIDVLMALQMKGVSVTWAADMNDNGVITNADVLAILQLK